MKKGTREMTQEQANWEWMDARVKVLEANHKIQLEINAKQFEYIAELEKALESSLNLNKAQAQRQTKELSDEEIDAISDEIPHYIDTYMGRRMFAKAILIKAQEK